MTGTKVWLVAALVVFGALFIVLCARAVWLNVDPPVYKPLPTPTPSPHETVPAIWRVPDAGSRPQ